MSNFRSLCARASSGYCLDSKGFCENAIAAVTDTVALIYGLDFTMAAVDALFLLSDPRPLFRHCAFTRWVAEVFRLGRLMECAPALGLTWSK